MPLMQKNGNDEFWVLSPTPCGIGAGKCQVDVLCRLIIVPCAPFEPLSPWLCSFSQFIMPLDEQHACYKLESSICHVYVMSCSTRTSVVIFKEVVTSILDPTFGTLRIWSRRKYFSVIKEHKMMNYSWRENSKMNREGEQVGIQRTKRKNRMDSLTRLSR